MVRQHSADLSILIEAPPDTPTVRILVCRVEAQPQVADVPRVYETFSALVDGMLECVSLGDDVELWSNEEALVYNLPFNREVPGRAPVLPDGFDVIIAPPDAAAPGTMGVHRIHGDFFLARGDEEGNIASLTEADIAKYVPMLGLRRIAHEAV